MATGDITKEVSYDKIEIVKKWNIQVRELTKILEEQSDGSKKLISHNFSRSIVNIVREAHFKKTNQKEVANII